MPPVLWPLVSITLGILASPMIDAQWFIVSIPLACIVGFLRPRFLLVAIALCGVILADTAREQPPLIADDGLPRRVTMAVERAPEFENDRAYLLAHVLTVDGSPVPSGSARLVSFADDYGSLGLLDDLALGHGDRIEVLVRLQRPTSYRNPGAFNYAAFLERQGIYWVGTIRSPRLIQVLTRGWHGTDRARQWTTSRISRHFANPTTRALVLGMVLGIRRALPPGDAATFEESGMIHLLVVSGFNLAIVAAIGLWIGRALPFGRHTREVLALAWITAYAVLVIGDTPVWRATVMAGILIIGSALDRGYHTGNALGLSALLILACDPRALDDQGFLLSFGAVTAIILIGVPLVSWTQRRLHPALRQLARTDLDRQLPDDVTDLRVSCRLRAERHGWPPQWIGIPGHIAMLLAEILMITSSIQLCLLPLTIHSFHRVAPVSAPLNVLGALVASTVTPFGLFLIFLPRVLGAPVAWTLDHLLQLLVQVAELGLEIPGSTIRVPNPPVLLWIPFALGLAALGHSLLSRRVWLVACSLVGVVSTVLIMVCGDFSPDPPEIPILTFLDVGQGDSILIEMPDGTRTIVDAGGVPGADPSEKGGFRIGEDVVSAYLFSRRIRRIDNLVLTHAHQDHMDGMFDIVRNFEVGEVWLGPNPMIPRYRELLSTLSAHAIPIRHVRKGDRMGPFTVVSPERSRRVGTEVRNDDSVVLLLEWGERTALLTGDLEQALGEAPAVVDVLKVPHHGSANTRLQTRGAVRVISVGANNRFGHPASSQLPALRTDLLGAIEVALSPAGPRVRLPALE